MNNDYPKFHSLMPLNTSHKNKSQTLFSACLKPHSHLLLPRHQLYQSIDAQGRTIKDLEPRLENVTPNELQVQGHQSQFDSLVCIWSTLTRSTHVISAFLHKSVYVTTCITYALNVGRGKQGQQSPS